VRSSLYRRWLGQFEGIFLEYTLAPPSSTLMEPPRCRWDRVAEVGARPRPRSLCLGCHPSPSSLAYGPLARPRPRLWCGLVQLLWISRLLSILFLFLLRARCNSAILLLFRPNYDVFSCLSCKTSELTKAMEMVSFKLLSILFLVNFIQLLVG
jgi:hypothetical protein